jgi:hypothetical protein
VNVVEKLTFLDGHEERAFDCPGCGEYHSVPVSGPKAWGFNGSDERPTFTPSILVRGTRCDWVDGKPVNPRPAVCHSFVRDGRIEFLSDCTHSLAGQTVALHAVKELAG